MINEMRRADHVRLVREWLIQRQNNICLICKKEMEKPCLDHQHKRNGGTGLVRGVLCRGCNALLGKIENNACRNRVYDLPAWLENAASYLRKEHIPILHYAELPKKKRLTKTSYNRLKKAVKGRMPQYPKRGFLTKKLEELFKRNGIEPGFYK